MPNERLRSSIAASKYSYERIAEHIGVDRKTVERWITLDRTPHRRHRLATTELLDVEETYLWPSIATDKRTLATSQAEFVQIYPTRGAVPLDFWRDLISDADESLDFLAFAALFLSDNNPDLAQLIRAKALSGVRVRILLGDPDGIAVKLRGQEEGIGEGLSERVRIILKHLHPLNKVDGVEIKLHNTALYASIFRSDESMLINSHIYGSPAAANPVTHLQRVSGGRMFDTYQRSFDEIWETASPYTFPAPQRRR
jgi:hypothetical protein